MQGQLAPIALFVYRRPEHTRKTLEFLQCNSLAKETELFVFSDAARSTSIEPEVEAVRKLVRALSGFKNVTLVEREKNLGLSRSIIGGVSEILKLFPRVIVMEDDLVSAPNMLNFMNEALERYENCPRAFSVTAFQFPFSLPREYAGGDAYFSYRASSWCWATWAGRWANVDWSVGDYAEFLKSEKARDLFARGGGDLQSMLEAQMQGKIDSWAIRWNYFHYKKEGYCLYPRYSKIQNIGFDGSGTHEGSSDKYEVRFDDRDRSLGFAFPERVEVDPEIGRTVKAFNSMPFKTRVKMAAKRALVRLGLIGS